METIKKVISLEQYKSRFNHKSPYIDYEGNITSVTENNWGEIACDYYFNDLEYCPFAKIKDKLPLVSGINVESSDEKVVPNNNCFRYKTMLYWYNWLNNYGKNCKYYKLCKRGSEYIWRELNYADNAGDFFKDFYGLGLKTVTSIAYIPSNYTDYSIGDVIEVNSEAVFFNEIFRVPDDETRYELKVLRFIQGFFENEQIDTNLSIPFVDIPIHITQTVNSLGLLTSTAKQWEPRKTYMLDDTVIYKNNTYVLRGGEAYSFVELTGGLYETFIKYIEEEGSNHMYYTFIHYNTIDKKLSPEEVVYDLESGRKKIYYKTSSGYYRIFLPCICHKAKKDVESGEFIFDTNYWEVNSEIIDSFNVDDSGIILEDGLDNEIIEDNYIKITSDSKLASLRRLKKSVDDDGNILPFILDSNNTTDTELPYTVGVHNVHVGSNDVFRGDIMKNIIIKSDNEAALFELSYNSDGLTDIYSQFYRNIKNEDGNEEVKEELEIGNGIKLYNLKNDNIVLYEWKEVSKKTEIDESIELISTLPTPSSEYFEKYYQITSQTDNIVYYEVYKCIKEKMRVIYTGTTISNIYITPSMLSLISKDLVSYNGYIKFIYVKDAFLIYNDGDKLIKKYEEDSGLRYTESYKYDISVAAINLTHDKNIETGTARSYKLYEYNITDEDIISGDNENVNTEDYTNVGKIYSVRDDDGNIIGYKRLLSEYNFIDMDFANKLYEVTSTDIENLKKNTILSKIEYTLESITEDDFQKDYVIKDEYTIGVEDISESIDVNVERGMSSSFEKHHILCEIKSLSDLENYRNNLFKI